MFVFTRLVRR